MDNCIFCKIIKKEIPSHKIYEDEKTYAFLDISDDVYGHTLVIPKNHCVNIFDCSKDDLQAMSNAVQKISNHYKDIGFDGVNIFSSNGECAEQGVFHFHIHIFPRKNNDNLKLYPKLSKLDNDLASVCEHLRLK